MAQDSSTPTILITGCSSGIGKVTAQGLKQRGYRVFATARKNKDVEQLKKAGFESLQLDLADSQSIKSAVNSVSEKTGGRLDALFKLPVCLWRRIHPHRRY